MELYKIMAVRQEVFAVEQNCVYQDADGKDYEAFHFFGIDKENNMVAYARLLPKGIAYQQYASIGRVLTTSKARGKNIGKIMMAKIMNQVPKIFKSDPIKISAQSYLIQFYESFGLLFMESST